MTTSKITYKITSKTWGQSRQTSTILFSFQNIDDGMIFSNDGADLRFLLNYQGCASARFVCEIQYIECIIVRLFACCCRLRVILYALVWFSLYSHHLSGS